MPTHDQKERAEYFCDLLFPLQKSFKNTEVFTFGDFKENLDVAYNALDDLWKQDKYSPAFPSDRMEHLLNIIGELIYFLIEDMIIAIILYFKLYYIVLLFMWFVLYGVIISNSIFITVFDDSNFICKFFQKI